MKRNKFITRNVILLDESRRETALNMVANMPIGTEVVGREVVKARKLTQNALMWAGPLRDIESQSWLDKRQFSAEAWHAHFKREFLPDDLDPDLPELVVSPGTYRKWDVTPTGERVCVASTTDLTVKGFGQYMEQVYAFGASCGVLFSTKQHG